ncbi:HNH endonuclease signature motif containing protein [Zhenhengia yiwuensis]|uniref:HNH endonuclease signature motif containing protein n=1 Tax=Zhenhengia yiwuensis TaxID=2763666 RepID=UPI002A74F15C|nr:HNH endonuclease signature motif containing protein [Zhenhengia yiwuensis]MDY3368391.1 HNH endonuclease signature motif containing protein [Zhenhengia yiwuensis]
MRDINKAVKYKKENPKCVNCGCTEYDKLHVHHIVPLCFGGNDVESNMVTLCTECHMRAHQKVAKGNTKNCTGRKPKVAYEEACVHIKRFLDGEIGSNELKDLLKVSRKYQSSVWDIRSLRKYLMEHGISLDEAKETTYESSRRLNIEYERREVA